MRDLCFRPPEDPNEPHLAKNGGNTLTAGQTLTALEALYDEEKMNSHGTRHNNNDVTDVVKSALAGIYAMYNNPERHLYVKRFHDDPPPREANIALRTVLDRLETAVMRDFPREVKELTERVTMQSGNTR